MMTTAQSLDEPVWQIPDRLRLELLAHLSVNGTSTKTMSYEEFLDWADEDTPAEWVEGKVVMSSPAGLRHQDLVTFLGGTLAGFSRLHDLGRIVTAPFQMKLLNIAGDAYAPRLVQSLQHHGYLPSDQ